MRSCGNPHSAQRQNLYNRWSKEFVEGGKKRLAGDTARVATSGEIKTCGRKLASQEALVELAIGCAVAWPEI